MIKDLKNSRLLTAVPPWIFIGAVAVLLPIFAFMTVENVNRQKKNNTRLLLEKGAALIRSFEAGARTGMMGMYGGGFRLQQLLTETAQQTDIIYIVVADRSGTVLAHNNPALIGRTYGRPQDLEQISRLNAEKWRIVSLPGGKNAFEVYRRFKPAHGLRGRGMRMGRMMFQRQADPGQGSTDGDEMPPLAIFVGLDMTPIEEAQSADFRHSVIMGATLLLIGFAGVIFLFLAHRYRETKVSLSHVQAFSDTLVEHMPIGLIALDARNTIASINQVAASVLKIPVSDAAGRPAEEILPPALKELVDASRLRKEVVEQEIECLVDGDRVIPLQASAAVLRGEDERLRGQVLLFKDLSEVRRLQKEIARNQRLATVGSLAAGVAHEIRNPLSSIKGFATYFRERYREVPEDLHIADIMIQEVDRLNRVVGQLLEFARPIRVTVKPVSLRTFIEQSLRLIERQAEEKRVRIRTRLPSDAVMVMIDPDRMNQVMLNLYLNAIDAMESAGGDLEVAVNADGEARTIQIQISDTGTGIAEANLAHIFDPYFTTKASGTGLGLAIAHNILEGHGGQIRVGSRPGEGTTVTLLLPAKKENRK